MEFLGDYLAISVAWVVGKVRSFGANQVQSAWWGTVAANIVLLLLGFCTGVVTARMLMPEGRGALAIILFWPHIMAAAGGLSLDEAITYRVARTPKERRSSIVGATAGLSALVALLSLPVAVLAVPWALGIERQAWWTIAIAYAMAEIPFKLFRVNFLAVDRGELRLGRYNLWRVCADLVVLSALTGLSVIEMVTTTAVVWAYWLGTFTVAVGLLACRWRDILNGSSIGEAWELLRLGWRFHTTNLLFLISTHIDRFVVMFLWDNAVVGMYVVAFTWASSGLRVLTVSFHSVLFPFLSATSDPEGQRALFAAGLRYASLLLVAGALALCAITPLAFVTVFGVSYGEATPVAVMLIVAYMASGFREIIVRGLRGFGRAYPGAIAEGINVIVFTICAVPFVKAFDLLGVGGALLVSNIASMVYLSRYLERQFDLCVSEWCGLNVKTVREGAHFATSSLSRLWAGAR